MIAQKESAGTEIVLEEDGVEMCAMPSRRKLHALRAELDALMLLTPAQAMARLDLDVASRRFRAMLVEAERERAEEDARHARAVAGAVERYVSLCDSLAEAAIAGGGAQPVPAPPPPPDIEVFEIWGTIKWFDAARGYGFIVPDNGLADVLLHTVCLRAGGYQTAFAGARVRCEVLRRHRGMQAFRIVEMDESTAIDPEQLPQRAHVEVCAASDWELATVKWFNRVRGFGYLSQGAGRPDIFVHIETLRRFGFTELRPGDIVQVRWGRGSKGLMAAALRPARGPHSYSTH